MFSVKHGPARPGGVLYEILVIVISPDMAIYSGLTLVPIFKYFLRRAYSSLRPNGNDAIREAMLFNTFTIIILNTFGF